MFTVRTAKTDDQKKITALYRKVVRQGGPGGVSIAINEKEISVPFVKGFMKKALKSGFEFIIDHPTNPDQIIGELHCCTLQPGVFNHVLGQLVVVVDPDFQGQGVGTKLFTTLQNTIKEKHSHILRVELFVFEFHHKAVEFYKKLGFQIEGKLEKRFHLGNNVETDLAMAWFNPHYNPPYKPALSSKNYRQYREA